MCGFFLSEKHFIALGEVAVASPISVTSLMHFLRMLTTDMGKPLSILLLDLSRLMPFPRRRIAVRFASDPCALGCDQTNRKRMG